MWALQELEGWSGYTAVGAVAARPMIGPLPSTSAVGRALTDLEPRPASLGLHGPGERDPARPGAGSRRDAARDPQLLPLSTGASEPPRAPGAAGLGQGAPRVPGRARPPSARDARRREQAPDRVGGQAHTRRRAAASRRIRRRRCAPRRAGAVLRRPQPEPAQLSDARRADRGTVGLLEARPRQGSTMCSYAGSTRRPPALADRTARCSTASCSRITRRSNGRSHDVRGGPRRVPGARALRVSERRHARPAVTSDPRCVGGASALRPEPGARRKGLVRERARAARARSASSWRPWSARRRTHIALTSSTTDGCNIVVVGARARSGRRNRDHRLRASGPAPAAPRLAARDVRVAEVAGRPTWLRSTTIMSSRHAAHEADRALARPLDDRAGDAGARAEARERAACCSSTARSRSVRSLSTSATLDFYTVSCQKWLCGPEPLGALVVRDPGRP